MDKYYRQHLDAWLNREFDDQEREAKNQLMTTFLTAHPEVLDSTTISWWDVLTLAERLSQGI